MRRLLEAPGQWRNDLQRSAPKCIAHRGRAGATRCNRICLPINTAICCSALPRLQGVAGASRATCRLREDYWTDKVIALEILRREDCATWLGSTVAQAKELLETYPHTRMVTHPVGPYVNDLELDEPRLIQRAPEDPAHSS